MRVFKLHDKKRGFTPPLLKITNSVKVRAGFTLVEVLIASAILVVTAVAFLDNLIQCSNLTEIGASKDIALNAAKGKLEEIAHSDLTQVMTYNGKTYPVSGLIAPLGQANPLTVAVTPVGATNLFDITVTVSWQQRGRTMSRVIRTTLISKG